MSETTQMEKPHSGVVVAKNATTTEESLGVGNAAKLREAAVKALGNLERVFRVGDGRIHFVDIVGVDCAKAELQDALAAPPRNCEIGTVADQLERFEKWFPASPYCDGQVHKMLVGYADWAQMPYIESEAAR